MRFHAACFPIACCLFGASTQSDAEPAGPPKRTQLVTVIVGVKEAPTFPGAQSLRPSPFLHLLVRREGERLPLLAPGYGSSINLLDGGAQVNFGPNFHLEGARRDKDVGAPFGRVARTFEAGGFVSAWVTPFLRVKAEVRKGLGGHRGLVGLIGGDAIVLSDDRNVLSVGPRVLFGDGRYQRAYFAVTPRAARLNRLPEWRPSGGVYALGAGMGLLHQFNGRWGFAAYASYDRLVGEAAGSPIIGRFGSRNQFRSGIGLTYTFARRR
jgi:outer membrane protein